jgi:hypothetical protein
MDINRPVSPLEEYSEKSHVRAMSDTVSTSSDAPETELRLALITRHLTYLMFYSDKL